MPPQCSITAEDRFTEIDVRFTNSRGEVKTLNTFDLLIWIDISAQQLRHDLLRHYTPQTMPQEADDLQLRIATLEGGLERLHRAYSNTIRGLHRDGDTQQTSLRETLRLRDQEIESLTQTNQSLSDQNEHLRRQNQSLVQQHEALTSRVSPSDRRTSSIHDHTMSWEGFGRVPDAPTTSTSTNTVATATVEKASCELAAAADIESKGTLRQGN
ncbi:unnamed protein product [Zymoseptoria tritici ST99CH_3D7]|uniref:Uncharacterized protein n=1 Tax=Zymoseptoria tritici (strain ST99CH_3D7) TaxID=1276538 RepID=A0A1X7S9C9_ZYMT9|nr:unnamed protein product [Zymoseptoria tritici ST99CH_3D7]